MKKFKYLLSFILIIISYSTRANITLLARLEKGKIYMVKSVSHQILKQSGFAQGTTETFSKNVLSLKLINLNNDIMTLEVSFDTVEIKTISSGGKREVYFVKPAQKDDYIGKIRNRFCFFKLAVKVSTSGKFMGFDNYKAFKDNVMSIIDSIPPVQKEKVQKQAENLLLEMNLQSRIEPLFAYIPGKEINNGDKWESTYVNASEQSNMLMSNNYTLDGIENNVVKISCNSEIESMPSSDSQRSIKAKGLATSKFDVNLTTGLLLKVQTKSHVEGFAIVNVQGNEMKIPILADTDTEIVNLK